MSHAGAKVGGLAEDVRECPATWALAASWVVVFVAMHLVQWWMGIPMPEGGFANQLAISSTVGHRFGDMTWTDVRHGEVWRLVTATFIHFSIVHVGMNTFGLIKLGQLIEPWYGSGPFLAICVAIGGLGNLVGGILRQAISSGRTALVGSKLAKTWPDWFEVTAGANGLDQTFSIPSGGGSTILLGLLGLTAVVGWRSKTRIGSFLRDQMVTMLVFTAVLGVVLINLIDNYGHAGGAIVGAGFGFIHRPLLRLSERSRLFRLACWVAVGVALLACLIAGVADDRADTSKRNDFLQTGARFQLDLATLEDLQRVSILVTRTLGLANEVSSPGNELDILALEPLLKAVPTAPLPAPPQPTSPDQWQTRTRTELAKALKDLAAHPAGTWGETTAKALNEVDQIGHAVLTSPPDYRQTYAFVVAWRTAARAILLDRDAAQTRLVQIERQAR